MRSTDRGFRTALLLGVLALFSLVAFWPALDGQFLSWDDQSQFVENENFRGLGWAHLRWASTTYLIGVFQPISWILLEAQYVAWGLNPRGYHAVSLGLHVGNVFLIFGLVRALFRRAAPDRHADSPRIATVAAAAATLLFAVHPLRVETVAWVSAQPYLVALFFSLLAIRAYLRVHAEVDVVSHRRRWWFAVTFVLTVAAMASKAVAITLPLMFLILDLYPLRRWGGERPWAERPTAVLLEKVPFVVAAAYFAVRAIEARTFVNSLGSVQSHGLGARIAAASYAVLFYPAKTLLPIDLSHYYPLPEDAVLLQPLYLACLVPVVALSVWFWRARVRRPVLLATWASYLLVLLPNVGLLQISDQIATDRYTYFSFVGVTAAIGGLFWLGLQRWRNHLHRALMIGGILGLASTCAWASRRQSLIWHDGVALWGHAYGLVGDRNSAISTALGYVLINSGRAQEALVHLDNAVKLNPSSVHAHTNRASALLRAGRFRESIQEALEVLHNQPAAKKVHLVVGLASLELDELGPAVHHLGLAVKEEKSSFLQIRFGVALLRTGKKEEALSAFQTAVDLAPDAAEPRMNLAWAYLNTGNPDAAVRQIRIVIQSHPSDAVARYHLATILLAQGLMAEAREQLEKAIQINPQFEQAKQALAHTAAP
jgi:protein O-mannosyl-transferase